MKKILSFDAAVPSLRASLYSGLSAYAVDAPNIGPPTTLWLRLCDGRILRVRTKMHDLSDWEEVGTLTFEVVSMEHAPNMLSLPVLWSDVQDVQKLVYSSDECEAESGFFFLTRSGNQLTVVPGADVYTLAIEAPFLDQPFKPENDLTAYFRKAL